MGVGSGEVIGRWWLFVVAVALVLVAGACSGSGSDGRGGPSTAGATTDPSPGTVVATTVAPAPDESPDDGLSPTVGPAELRSVLDDVVVVDVRPSAVYAAGHIAGAISLPVDNLNAPAADGVEYQLADLGAGAAVLGAAGIGADTAAVVYDDSQGVYAARAYFALKYWGHERVQLLDGSLANWVDAGNTLDTEPVVLDAVDHPVASEPGAHRLVYDQVGEAQATDAAFVDARAPGEYDGSVVLGEEAGGHIPGAANIEWTEALDDDGFFRDNDSLARIYADAGLLHDGSVVTYCYIGVRASHSWFVLSELLGYPDVGMYDGSWTEYGTAPDAEVES